MTEPAESLPVLLARRAREDPDRVFARDVTGAVLTYAQLEGEVCRWAGALRGLGVEPGDRVVVMLTNRLECVSLWLAIARLGAIEVPANTGYRGRFLEHLVNNSGARVAVTAPAFVDRFAASEGQIPALERLVVLGEAPFADVRRLELAAAGPLLASAVVPDDLVAPDPAEVATILYTSGTTGASKGVLVTWTQVHWSASAIPPFEGRGEEDVFYSPFPQFHMSGKLVVCAAATLKGEMVLREAFSTSEFWHDVDRFGCTTALIIGAVATILAKQPPQPDDAHHPLRNVILAPPPDDPKAFCERFGLRAAAVFNMTELSAPISTGWDQELIYRNSVGRVRPGYRVRLVDDLDREVPAGEIGEIVVRSDEPWRLMAGYWGMPEQTVEAWRNLWLHTGDLGRMDPDGAFFFLDRKKDAIRRRGENISSMELEAEIAEHELVAEAAVVGVPSELGEEDVKAFVVPRPGFTPEGLLAFLEPRVPAFMLPRYVAQVDELPKTPTEKVRKAELKERPSDERTWARY